MLPPSTVRLPTSSNRDTPGYITYARVFFDMVGSLSLSEQMRFDCVWQMRMLRGQATFGQPMGSHRLYAPDPRLR
jgi:hypothetical protein